MGADAPAAWRARGAQQGFLHEAFLYRGVDEFVDGIASFARAALEASEPVLVMVGARKIDALRNALGGDAQDVRFVDMERVGANPARIIPAWHEFVSSHAPNRPLRGVGEPIWHGRAADELGESQRHEALLNLAFADARGMWLVCPYDTGALDASVIDEAHCSHPFVSRDQLRTAEPSATYRDDASILGTAFDGDLPPAPREAPTFSFGLGDLRAVRALVEDQARRFGLSPLRTEDFVVAANEVATNSIRPGGGRGTITIWHDRATGSVVCEVTDRGRIVRPLAGRERPHRDRTGGAGLFLANQFCDLVQLRSSDAGTTVRLHVRRGR